MGAGPRPLPRLIAAQASGRLALAALASLRPKRAVRCGRAPFSSTQPSTIVLAVKGRWRSSPLTAVRDCEPIQRSRRGLADRGRRGRASRLFPRNSPFALGHFQRNACSSALHFELGTMNLARMTTAISDTPAPVVFLAAARPHNETNPTARRSQPRHCETNPAPCRLLSPNSHLGVRVPTPVLYPGLGLVNSNTATGLRAFLCDERRRSRSTGKERDAETGLDYFGARYFSGAQGRFTSPDWSAVPQAVPYADLTDPQTLNLYSYVRNNPLSRPDLDGHCPGEDCSQVKIEAKVEQKPTTVQNIQIKDINGNNVAKATGVEGKIVFTVKVNGTPTAGLQVTETNQGGDTKNDKTVSSTLVQGKGKTNGDGQIGDTIGIYHPTDGQKSTNETIKADFSNNTWTSSDKQTLSVTLPGGCTCSATSTRTLTNASPDGPSKKYTLTTTQPVVNPQRVDQPQN